MDKTEAIKKITKMWGKKAGYRVDKNAVAGEEREKILASIPFLGVAQKATADAVEMRRKELLKDPKYLELKEEADKAKLAADKARGAYYHRRVTIGYVSEMGFFHVKGHGDNWAEAIAEAEGK